MLDYFNKIENNENITLEDRTIESENKYLTNKIIAISNHSDVKMRKIAFNIENKKNIVINGNNSRLLFTGNILPFYINESENITIKNLTIDYFAPTIIEGKIIDYTSSYCDIEFLENKVYVKNRQLFFSTFAGEVLPWEDRVIEVNKIKDELIFYSDDKAFGEIAKFDNCEKINVNSVRIYTTITKSLIKGNILLFRGGLRDNAGILCNNSVNLKFENVIINYANGMGIICQYSKNIIIDNLNVCPSGDRYFSTAADATHFVGCSGNIEVKNSFFMGQMDDIINVHGMYVIVTEVIDGIRALVKIMHQQQEGIMFGKVGDNVDIIDKVTMIKVESNTIKSIEKIDEEYQIIEFTKRCKNIEIGFGIENISAYPNIYFHHNKGLSNRARGLLLSTPKKVVIENNYIKSSGSGIKISGDMNDYYESGSVKNVVIKSNIFDNCGYIGNEWGAYAILIDPEIKNPKFLKSRNLYYHTNISIESNVFIGSKKILFARSAKDIKFIKNIYDKQKSEIEFESCEEIYIE